MTFRHYKWHWYDLVFIGLAAAIVFPDAILDWIGAQTGRVFRWWHLALVEAVAIVVMIAATALLASLIPEIQWWRPLPAIGLIALLRAVIWFVTNVLGFHD